MMDSTCATYVFDTQRPESAQSSVGEIGIPVTPPQPVSITTAHKRSVSLGGAFVIVTPRQMQQQSDGMTMGQAPKGHTRAQSQGQIGSHNRTGSKADFILPPGHQERSERADSCRGHSRQASRSDSIYTLRRHNTSVSSWKEKLLFWRRPKPGEDNHNRPIVPNHTVPPNTPSDQQVNKRYIGNKVRTTKYTILSFLPKNLFEQFHRFANLYFLFIVLLNWWPAVNAFGKEIAMLPVIFVLGVTAIKDIFEDRRRHRSDKRINGSTCRVYKSNPGHYVKVLWCELRVGDLVHLSCNEIIPADIVLLQTSDDLGLCYIETTNLDGESNLKQREVPRGYIDRQSTFDASEFRDRLEVGAPTTKIYRFHGCIIHQTGERVPLSKDNLLLRDCVLKNTSFVKGIIVYAGHETKAMLNNGGPRYKCSALERQMNMEVIYCIFILIFMCLLGSFGFYFWTSPYVYNSENSTIPFLFDDKQADKPQDSNLFYDSFVVFWTFVVILQVMIPVSLYVTIEMTKLMQVFHINQDIDMYDEKTDKRVECRALNIPEELGQVQYIFSDKTGTLTENKMTFRHCTIGGVDYSHMPEATPISETMESRENSSPAPIILNPQLQRELSSGSVELFLDGRDSRFHHRPQFQRIQDFFLILAVCNTVVVAKYPHRDEMNSSGMILTETDHSIQCGASEIGIPTLSNQDHYTQLVESRSITPSPPPPPLLEPSDNIHKSLPRILEMFTSGRTLSPIHSSTESTPADSPVPYQRPKLLQLPNFFGMKVSNNVHASRSPTPSPGELKPIFEAESPDELALVQAAYAYDCKLLRRTTQYVNVTLPGEGPMEFKVLNVLPFDSVRKRMSVILKHPITNERILYVKGADSSILPKLKYTTSADSHVMIMKTQQHLNNYARRGLRILVLAKKVLSHLEYEKWASRHREADMMIGACREKELSVCYREIENNLELIGATGIEDRLQEGVPDVIANLRQAGIVVWVLTGDKQETAVNIAFSCKLFTSTMEVIKLNARSCSTAEHAISFHLGELEQDSIYGVSSGFTLGKERALVVDGKTLTFILDPTTNLHQPFLNLTKHCAAVLCCRATPLQKAFIVKIVKEQLKMRTLAIGDGANDVSMIQTADVGIGISGQEGMQAVMASDFAISRFKHIERLLLVHGHWCYDRLARMVQYFFYKNAAFVMVLFWFQIYCGCSGTLMIDSMYLQLYNLLFTSIPPMAIGIYDKDCPDNVLLACPKLYRQGRIGECYKRQYFWFNMGDAVYQSVVIFFVAYGAYHDSIVGIWEFGTTVCTACLYVMLFHMAIETRSWTILHVLSIVISLVSYYGFAFLYNAYCLNIPGLSGSFMVMQNTIITPVHWFVVFLSTALALLPRLVARCMETCILPSDVVKAMLYFREHRKSDSISASWSSSAPNISVLRRVARWCRNRFNHNSSTPSSTTQHFVG